MMHGKLDKIWMSPSLGCSTQFQIALKDKNWIFSTPPRYAVLINSCNESVMYTQPDRISASLQSVFVDACVY
jgi:hypothetical protein